MHGDISHSMSDTVSCLLLAYAVITSLTDSILTRTCCIFVVLLFPFWFCSGIAGATSSTLNISASLPIQCTQLTLAKNLFESAAASVKAGKSPEPIVLWAEVLNGASEGVDDMADVIVFTPEGEYVATFHTFRSRGMGSADEDKPAAVEQCYFEWQWKEQPGIQTETKSNTHFVLLHAKEQSTPSPAVLSETFGPSVRAHVWSGDESQPRTLPTHLLDGVPAGTSVQIVVLIGAGNNSGATVDERYERIHKNASWMLTIQQMLKELLASWSGLVSLSVLSSLCLGAPFAEPLSSADDTIASQSLDLTTAALPGMLQVWQAECSSVTARLLCSASWEDALSGGTGDLSSLRATLHAELNSTEQPTNDILFFLRNNSEGTWRRFAAVRDAVQLPGPNAESDALVASSEGGKKLHAFVFAGGNGSLGVELAASLTESLPAEHALAIFASRRGTFQSKEDEALAATKLATVRYQSVQCNIAEPGAAAQMLSNLQKDASARGYTSVSVHVLNMAMVLRDALLEKLSSVQMDEVLRPKVMGSLRLLHAAHAIMAEQPKQQKGVCEVHVESLMLFSSTTAFLGNIGQLAYGAANSYLDALAVSSHQLRSGLKSSHVHVPVYAFNFPPIVGAGFLATNDKVAAALDHAGYVSLTAKEVYRAVRDLIAQAGQETVSGSILASGPQGHASVGCIRIRPVPYLHQQPHIKGLLSWSKVLARWKQESVRLPPAQLAQLFGGAGGAASGSNLSALDAAAVSVLVAGMVADVQGIPALSAAQLRATLSELGIDSQGVTLLNNHFKSSFQVTLPISALLDPASTIPYVSKLLADKLAARAVAARPTEEGAPGAQTSASAAAGSNGAAVPAGVAPASITAESHEFVSEKQPPFLWLFSGSSADAVQHALSGIEISLRTSWDNGAAGFVQASDMEQQLAVAYQADQSVRRTISATLGQLPAAVEKLIAELGGSSAMSASQPASAVRFVFLFPGQGSEFPGMLDGWLEHCPPFRKGIEHCCRTLAENWNHWSRDVPDTPTPATGTSVKALQELLFPSKPKEGAAPPVHAGSAMVQLALFVFSYSLARVLIDAGVQPSLMLGHSLGEIVAAAVSGVFTINDALRTVWVRGRVMERAPLGAMLAVRASESRVRELLTLAGVPSVGADSLQIAAINGPQQTVVAGLGEKVDHFAATLKQQGIPCSRLGNKHAFHTAAMAPAAGLFEKHLASLRLSVPRVPYLSNVSGGIISPSDAATPGYYSKHMTQSVQFHKSALELVSASAAQPHSKFVLVELGPGSTLTKLLRTESTAAAALDEGRWVSQVACEKPTSENAQAMDASNLISKVLTLSVQAGTPLKRLDRLLARPVCSRLLQLSHPQARLWINAALNGALTFAKAEQSARRKLTAGDSNILMESDDRSLAYITSGTYRLRGEPLPVDDLQKAVAYLLQAHAVLRTSFAYDSDGTPVQRIHSLYRAEREVVRENHELAHLSLDNESNWSQVWDVIRVESGRPFPLDRAPLFRVLLVQLKDGQLLHFTFQHLIMDFAAGTVFGAELFRALSLVAPTTTEKQGVVAPFLPPPSRSSLDIAWLQRELLLSDAGERRLSYWLNKLQSPGATLPHKIATTTLKADQAAARAIEITLPAEHVAQLQQVAARHNSLPSTLLLGFATAVLYEQAEGLQHGASADVRVGMVHRPSNLRGGDRVIGCLFDILVLSQNVDAELVAQWPALLEKLENTKAESVQHAYPLTEMLRRMRTEQQQQQQRGATGAPRPTATAASLWQHDLFQLLYNFRSLSGGAYEAQRSEGTTIELVRHHHWREAQFPIQLDIDWPLGAHQTGAGHSIPSTPATISVSYDDSISSETAQAFFDAFIARVRSQIEDRPVQPRRLSISAPVHFAPSLEAQAAAAAAPSPSVDLIPQLPPPAPTSQILMACNAANSVTDLLVNAMHQYPDSIALEGNTLLGGHVSLTYRQLDHLTDAFSRRLLGHKTPSPVVGLALPRSVEMTIAALGTLRAGRCYAPLDPDFFPVHRMEKAISSVSDMRILVQAPRKEHQLSHLLVNAPANVAWIEFGLDDATLAAAMKNTPMHHVPQNRQSRAYVEFTSGSTGIPKV
jgi:malonyl CoA-acyl carrier protein transacylase/non-ribosomal peptide synthetase component F